MTENHILIKIDQQQVLENVLFDLANLYYDTEYAHGIQLYRKKGVTDSFLIRFTNNPDFERFSYFTNYLVYPIDIKDFKPIVRGFYQTGDIIDFPQLNIGKWVMVYDNEKDKDVDNVFLVTEENKTFIYDFGGNLKQFDKIIHEFRNFNIELNNYNHIIDIYPSNSTELTEVKPWWKFW